MHPPLHSSLVLMLFVVVFTLTSVLSLKAVSAERNDSRMRVKVLGVSAFKNIGRGNWTQSTRSVDEYFKAFGRMVNLTSSWPYKLTCFCEPGICSRLHTQLHFKETQPLNINDTYFKYIQVDKEAMKSQRYQQKVLIRKNRGKPEYTHAAYNAITNSKPNFIRRAAEIYGSEGYTHYIWLDFGWVRSLDVIPSKLCWDLIDDGKIHVTSSSDVRSKVVTESEIVRETQTGGSPIMGYTFVVPKELVVWFAETWHDMYLRYQRFGMMDDDQGLMVNVIKENRGKFNVHVTKGLWFRFFREHMDCEKKI